MTDDTTVPKLPALFKCDAPVVDAAVFGVYANGSGGFDVVLDHGFTPKTFCHSCKKTSGGTCHAAASAHSTGLDYIDALRAIDSAMAAE